MAIEFITAPKYMDYNSLESDLFQVLSTADNFRKQGDYKSALPLYEQAGQAGNIYAIRWAGQLYLEGLHNINKRQAYFEGWSNYDKKYDEALYWFRLGEQQNDKFCIANIGVLYLDGCGVAQSNEQAFAYLKRSSDMGNPVASYLIGKMCFDGKLVKNAIEPYNEAIQYYNLALTQNPQYTPAINGLAFCYMDGKGVQQDFEKAEGLFKHAIELGSKKAQHYYIVDLKAAKEKRAQEIQQKIEQQRAQEAKKRKKRKEILEMVIVFSVVVMFYAATQGILVEVFLPIVLIAVAVGLLIVFIKGQEEKEERHKSQYGSVKCYHCGSTNVYRMTYDDTRASIAFWGSASSKVGMTYHCDSCGREW